MGQERKMKASNFLVLFFYIKTTIRQEMKQLADHCLTEVTLGDKIS